MHRFLYSFIFILFTFCILPVQTNAQPYSPEERKAITTLIENSQANIKKLQSILPAKPSSEPFTAYKNYLEERLRQESELTQKAVRGLLAQGINRTKTNGYFGGGFGMKGQSAAIEIEYPENFLFSWEYFIILTHELEHAIQAFQSLPEYNFVEQIFPDEEVSNPPAFFREANAMVAEHRFLQFASNAAIEEELIRLKYAKMIDIDEKKKMIQILIYSFKPTSEYVEAQWNYGRYSLENLNVYLAQPKFALMMQSEYCNYLLDSQD